MHHTPFWCNPLHFDTLHKHCNSQYLNALHCCLYCKIRMKLSFLFNLHITKFWEEIQHSWIYIDLLWLVPTAAPKMMTTLKLNQSWSWHVFSSQTKYMLDLELLALLFFRSWSLSFEHHCFSSVLRLELFFFFSSKQCCCLELKLLLFIGPEI